MTKKKFNLFVLIGRWIQSAYDRFILWMSCTSFSLFLAVFVSLKRYRMSHNNGIAGTGWLRVLDNPKIPRNEFFKPGRVFDIRVRHATAAFLDDAMKTLRSISIKFANHRSKSPLDLEFNTGHSPGFWSALSFIRFAKTRGEKYGVEWV
ncbi:MAG: hypothetical protein LPK47_12950, partial [Bacteroidota bacterium]|nr:hypothetical protein [Bacteroidota bacterium]